ncbi:MAG: glycosyltransferase family 39 protein [Anaerolineales bacterium]|nr:glycosyltransferase family 39 protein [Anaerolineales bacterium]
MSSDPSPTGRRMPPPWAVPLGTALLLAARWLTTPRGLDDLGIEALRDAGLSILLWLLVGVLAAGTGRRLLRLLRLQPAPSSFSWLLAEALGLGAIAYLVFALGMIGWLTAAAISTLLLGLSIVAAEPSAEAVAWLLTVPAQVLAKWKRAGVLPRLTLVLLTAIFSFAFVQTLTPPWDYDGLMYHLVGPRLFLEVARIYPVPDNWYVNGPFSIEMLFTIGMSRGDDVFPKLVHYLFGLLLVAATWLTARRWLGGIVGWLGAAILVGLPTLPVWASFAYIDLAWAAFEFLALACVVEWWRAGERRWLVLAGVFAGLAIGTKYIAAAGLGLLALAVVCLGFQAGWRRTLSSLALLLLPGVLVAAPWYAKNWLWFGNPVYPLYLGGPEWSARRLELYMGYLNGFGAGKGILSALALPWNAYAQHERFGTVMNLIDMPSLLFLLLFAYPFLRKNRIVTLLLAISITRIGIWFAGSQQLRFLLPIAPALAISSAYVVDRIAEAQREKRLPLSALLPSLTVGLLAVSLFYQLVMFRQFKPLPVSLGLETRRGFLSRMVKDFPVGRMAVEELPEGSRVLLIGDGRGYYCLPACLPDPDHYRWSAEISALPSDDSLTQWLAELGATHILFSIEDLDFLLQHDQQNVVRMAVERLTAYRDLGCLREVQRDEWVVLYEAVCGAGEPQARSEGGMVPSTRDASLIRTPAEWRLES